MVAYLYAVEQCSATNNLSIASALQPVVILEGKKWGGTAGPKKNQGGQHKYLSCMVIFHCFED